MSKLIRLFRDKINIIQIISCFLCAGVLYYRVFENLVHDWGQLPDFSHGYLIPFVSLYLVWDRRHILGKIDLRPDATGYLILLAGIFLLFLGNLAHENFLMRVSFLFVISGIIITLLGWVYYKAFLFPIAFLIFMIPIPSILLQKITFPLQLLVSQSSQQVLGVIGVPMLREGNIIILSNARLEVAEACSGIRSLMSLLALGAIVAYFTHKDRLKQAIIVFSCIPLAIIVNVMRVVITVILTERYGSSVAEGLSHSFGGLITFFVALILLLIIGALLSRLSRTSDINA